MNKAQQILKAGKFTVHGIEYDVDHAGTNNDTGNNIQTGDIQRIHGVRPGEIIRVPPFNAELIEVTQMEEEQAGPTTGATVVDPPTEEQAEAPEPELEPAAADLENYIPGQHDDVAVEPPVAEPEQATEPEPEPDQAEEVEPVPAPAPQHRARKR